MEVAQAFARPLTGWERGIHPPDVPPETILSLSKSMLHLTYYSICDIISYIGIYTYFKGDRHGQIYFQRIQ